MSGNGLEIELKFLLEIPVKDFMAKLGASAERVYQRTVMFDNDEELMQKTNGRIRLRQTGDKVSLSYKLPLPSETVKKEIEWETNIDNWQVGEELLKAMGFHKTTAYEKYRTSFEYNRVKIEIDEYPFSNFVEIEGDEDEVKNAALEIGFNLDKALTRACDTLFTEWRLQKGLPMKPLMMFEDYDK